ncbi:MAG: ABC transporter substrate-binding protein [Candidatus Baltobacteraceae bacterium]
MKQLVALLLAAGFITGCTKVGTQGGTAGSSGPNSFTQAHVLRYATAEDISSLNPHLSQQTTLSLMSSLTMAWLLKWDHKNQPIPELATEVPTKANGGISADGLTITYHLRKDAKWSDGVPFNADDVVFTTAVVLNKANNEVSRAGWDKITKVDEPDKYTVVYHLTKPYSPFVTTFFSSAGANPCILPKHILSGLPNINNAPYNSLPIGIGPFKYKSWKRSDSVTMVPNPTYFRGTPKLQKVVFQIVPDRNTVMTQLQSQSLDLWYPVPGSYFSRFPTLHGYSFIRQPAYLFNHQDFNLSSPKVSDVRVRKALEFAMDRAEFRHKIAHDVGYLQEEPAPQTAPYWDPGIKMVPFDLAKANELLDQAGWVRGADGLRAKNGVKLSLNYAAIVGSPDVDQQLELMRVNFKKVGADLDIHHYSSATYFQPMESGGILYSGKWDMTGFAWGADPIGDWSFLYACDAIPPAGQNDLHWCNKKVDAATHALFAHYDQAERNQDDKAVFEGLAQDTPMIVTSGREDIYIFNSDLKNFHPNDVTPFDDMMNVDI